MKIKDVRKKPGEQSFTIIETLIALAIMLPVIVESVGTQGAIINSVNYMRRVTQATWLAESIMAKVEYNYQHYPFKEMKTSLSGEENFGFEDLPEDFDYTYKLDIQDWDLPIFDLLLGGGLGGGGEEGEESEPSEDGGVSGSLPGIDKAVESIFEGEILKIAKVEVFWPEGARKDKVELSLLLTNQKALDFYLASKGQIWEKYQKKINDDLNQEGDKPPAPPPTNSTPPPPTP